MKKWLLLPIVIYVIYMLNEAPSNELPNIITSIEWSDGDSGRLNGNVPFRLANIDAPETGIVGSIGGAKCESEREQGYEAKAYLSLITATVSEIEIAEQFGQDRNGQHVVTLMVNGMDIGDLGVLWKHLKPWPQNDKKALSNKPNWCS